MSPDRKPSEDDRLRSETITFESFEAELTEHLEATTDGGLAELRQERQEVEALWSALESTQEKPPAELSMQFAERFADTFDEDTRENLGASEPGLLQPPTSQRRFTGWLQLAAALLIGLGLGLGLATGSRGPSASAELARIASEIDQLKLTLTAALGDGRSPSTRLTAIGATRSLADPGTAVLDALLDAVRTDSNVGVRLAAIDALDRYIDSLPEARNRLLDSLADQASPLVQMALLDRTRAEDLAAAGPVGRLLAREDLLTEVRERALSLFEAPTSVADPITPQQNGMTL